MAVAVEFLRRGIDSATALGRELRARKLIPPDCSADAARMAAARALGAAESDGFRKIGPATIEDARGALDLFAAEMLETSHLAKAAGAFAEVRECMVLYLRAHGIRIDDDIQSVHVLIGREGDKSRTELRASVAKMLDRMTPTEAANLVMLAARLDDPEEAPPHSKAWSSDSSPLGEAEPEPVMEADFSVDPEGEATD